MQRQFIEKQALENVEAQIDGEGNGEGNGEGDDEGDGVIFVEDPNETSNTSNGSRLMSAPQVRMLKALMAPLAEDLDAQFTRRTKAINALVAYCPTQEPVVPSVHKPVPVTIEIQKAVDPAEALPASAMVKTPGEKINRCFICVAGALTLNRDDLYTNALCRDSHDCYETAKHFKRTHLNLYTDDEKLIYPLCHPDAPLKHKMHLQRHAESVHGINLVFQVMMPRFGS